MALTYPSKFYRCYPVFIKCLVHFLYQLIDNIDLSFTVIEAFECQCTSINWIVRLFCILTGSQLSPSLVPPLDGFKYVLASWFQCCTYTLEYNHISVSVIVLKQDFCWSCSTICCFFTCFRDTVVVRQITEVLLSSSKSGSVWQTPFTNA